MKAAILLTLLLVGPAFSQERDNSSTNSPPGRFQLLASQFGPDPITLRLDTKTGRTWQLVRVPIDTTTSIVGWVEVSENPLAMLQQVTTKPATPAANASKPPAR